MIRRTSDLRLPDTDAPVFHYCYSLKKLLDLSQLRVLVWF